MFERFNEFSKCSMSFGTPSAIDSMSLTWHSWDDLATSETLLRLLRFLKYEQLQKCRLKKKKLNLFQSSIRVAWQVTQLVQGSLFFPHLEGSTMHTIPCYKDLNNELNNAMKEKKILTFQWRHSAKESNQSVIWSWEKIALQKHENISESQFFLTWAQMEGMG